MCKRGRLAGAVGPQQSHDLARVDGEVEVAHDHRAAVARAQPIELEQRTHAIDSQVGPYDLRVVPHRGRRSAGEEHAVIEDVDDVAHLEDE